MKKSMYTKLRDRVDYAKATGDDLTPEQIVSAEAVLADNKPAPRPQPAEKKNLTDRTLKALKSAAADRPIPYDVMDASLRTFGVRRFPNREVVFILYRRIGGSRKPTRRKLGRYPEMSLAEARIKAEAWIALIRLGRDPSLEAARKVQDNIDAQARRQSNSFKRGLEAYYRHKADEGLRSIDARKVAMNRELAPWMNLALQDIDGDAVRKLITAIKTRGHPAQALTTLRLVKSFFSWVTQHGGHGVRPQDNPCSGISTSAVAGTAKIRERFLSDEELGAFWRAVHAIPYPSGHFLKTLLMASLRRCEASRARWEEFDLYGAKPCWTVPGSRMKKTKPTDKPRDHIVWLTPDLIELFESIPRFDNSYVFSNSGGKKALADFVGVKAKVDALMRTELGERFKPWELHDLRRTARSKYSEFGIAENVAELLIGHAKVDIYNKWASKAKRREVYGK